MCDEVIFSSSSLSRQAIAYALSGSVTANSMNNGRNRDRATPILYLSAMTNASDKVVRSWITTTSVVGSQDEIQRSGRVVDVVRRYQW